MAAVEAWEARARAAKKAMDYLELGVEAAGRTVAAVS